MFIVRCLGDLQYLIDHKRKIKGFDVDFSCLAMDENIVWQQRIAGDLYSCGCNTGAVFSLAGFAAYMIWTVFSGSQHATAGLLIVLLMGAVGKGAGLLLAKRRLNRNIRLLTIVIVHRQPSVER